MRVARRLKGLSLAALIVAQALPAAATTITFDDLRGAEDAIPNGYNGLDWSNFNFLDAVSYQPSPSGYAAGLTSGRKLAYSGFTSVDPQSISAATPFQLQSFQMTAAWYDGIKVTVQGNLNGNEVFRRFLTPGATAPTLYSFGGATIDSLMFVSDFSAGTLHPGYDGCCYQFAIDDLTVDGIAAAVPEPGSWAMMIIGFGVIGTMLRTRPRRVVG